MNREWEEHQATLRELDRMAEQEKRERKEKRQRAQAARNAAKAAEIRARIAAEKAAELEAKRRSLPWKVLGLPHTATRAQVRSRYRDLVKVSHPDRGGDAGTFRRQTEAYNTLLGSDLLS